MSSGKFALDDVVNASVKRNQKNKIVEEEHGTILRSSPIVSDRLRSSEITIADDRRTVCDL